MFRKLVSILITLSAVLLAFAAFLADRMLGVVAFAYGYLTFCLLAALVFGGVWYACSKKYSMAFALIVFGALSANFFLPPPSERLLRSAMLEAPPGTDAGAIEDIVERQYEGSRYAMPTISRDRAGRFDRVHVSLLSQKSRSCTSIIFLVENGRVSRSIFSPD
ncbi:MAG: hypothetical protein AB8D78_14815 [Akkermansiaceae bacterium]